MQHLESKIEKESQGDYEEILKRRAEFMDREPSVEGDLFDTFMSCLMRYKCKVFLVDALREIRDLSRNKNEILTQEKAIKSDSPEYTPPNSKIEKI